MPELREGQCLHECDVCGKVAPWDENWSQYGSLASEENAGRLGVWKACSVICQQARTPKEIEDAIIERCGFNPFKARAYG